MPIHDPSDYPGDGHFVGASDGLNGAHIAAVAVTAAAALPAVTTIAAACTARISTCCCYWRKCPGASVLSGYANEYQRGYPVFIFIDHF